MNFFFKRKLNMLNPLSNIMEKYYKSKNQYLFEGLIKSYDIDKLINHMCDYCNFTVSKSDFTNTLNDKTFNGFIQVSQMSNNENVIEIYFYDDETLVRMIQDVMNVYGYKISRMEDIPNSNGLKWCSCESKFTKDISDIVKEKGIIYHITLASNLQKILDSGFVPKSKNKATEYDSRIYFTLDDFDNLTWKQFGYELFGKVNDDFVVFAVKSSELDNKFMFDPNMDNAVFTYENIHPKNIIDFKKLNLFKPTDDEINHKDLLKLNEKVDNKDIYKNYTKSEINEHLKYWFDKYYFLLKESLNDDNVLNFIKNDKKLLKESRFKNKFLENIIMNLKDKML